MADFLVRRDHRKLQIKSKEKIIEFLSSQQTGRVASIDENGFPQIIPMNFVFINDIIPIFERFIKAGVNHFVIRFWGKNYFGSIDKFATHVIPYFKEQNK